MLRPCQKGRALAALEATLSSNRKSTSARKSMKAETYRSAFWIKTSTLNNFLNISRTCDELGRSSASTFMHRRTICSSPRAFLTDFVGASLCISNSCVIRSIVINSGSRIPSSHRCSYKRYQDRDASSKTTQTDLDDRCAQRIDIRELLVTQRKDLWVALWDID